MHVNASRALWHVELNNPTDEPITVELQPGLPGVPNAIQRSYTVEPGGRLLEQCASDIKLDDHKTTRLG